MSVYVRDLGASYAELGGVLSVASLSAGLLAVMGGWASDRYDRVLMMSLGACVGGLAYAIKAVAPSWPWLIPAVLLAPVGGVLASPAIFGVVSDLAPAGRRGSFFGYLNASLQFAFVLGPVVGGWVYQAWGYRVMLWILAFMMFVAALLRLVVRDPGVRRNLGDRSRWSFVSDMRKFVRACQVNPKLWRWLVATTVPLVGVGLVLDVSSVYLREMRHVQYVGLGLLTGISTAAGIPGALVGGALADRFSLKTLAALQVIGWVVHVGALLLVADFWPLMLFLGVSSLMRTVAQPAVSAYMAHLTDPEQRGTYYAAARSLNALIGIPWPAVAGAVWQAVGARPLFGLAFAWLLGSLVVFWALVEPVQVKKEVSGDRG